MAVQSKITKILPPGDMGLPVIGHSLRYFRDLMGMMRERQAQYGDVFMANIFFKPPVVMTSPEASRFLLSSGMKHFSWREGWPSTFQELLGNSLFVQDGEEHRQKRKLLMPAFHREALHRYLQTMETMTTQYLSKWEQMGTFAWFEENKKLTFDIANYLLLGAESGEETATLSQHFTDLTKGMLSLGVRLPFTTFGKALKAREALLQHIQDAIEKRKANPAQDALTLLIQTRDEDGNALSDEELTAQALLLLFAGHETTTSMITSFCMAMEANPDVWEKARAEQLQIGIGDSLAMDDIKQMTYLEQVLKEVERYHTPVAGGFRGVVEAFDYGDYHIPEGYQVLYFIPLTHYDSDIWDDPHTFNPDRFAKENTGNQPRFSLIGFGGGPRICVGYAFAQLEMKVIASYLLRHYTWEALPDQNLEMVVIPTLHPADGYQVRFSRR